MTRLILATVAAIMLGAPVALAASPSSSPTAPARVTRAPLTKAEQCSELDAQFQKMQAAQTDKTAMSFLRAQALHREGARMCSSNKQAAGAKYIRSGVRILEAHPNT